MKNLLFQFDSHRQASSFDTVVAYDGGADRVIRCGDVDPSNVAALVEGTIFTRPLKAKKHTAIFIGGNNMAKGEAILAAVKQCFFADFRVSVMLDSNGGNTTAAASVAKILSSCEVVGKKAVVLAGTGAVGARVATMLAHEGAREVVISSRRIERAREVCEQLNDNFNITITPAEAADADSRGQLVEDAQIVFSAGEIGVELLPKKYWENNPHIEVLADANVKPPLGINGIEVHDKGQLRHGKIIWGALGFGGFKLQLQRACIQRLFERNDQLFDTIEILELAKIIV